MYSIKTTFYPALVAALLLIAPGCGKSDDAAVPSYATAQVNLLARGGSAASAYRLLVFSENNDDCLLNRSFGSGNESIRLANGSYRFVTLSDAEGLNLPAAGTTIGITPSTVIGLKEGTTTWPEAQVSTLTTLALPGASIYEATLKPATCRLKLTVTGIPEGKTIAYELKNMYTGIRLDGLPAGLTATYSLKQGDNICQPTDGNAILSYTVNEGTTPAKPVEMNLGYALEPGYTLTAHLEWIDKEMHLSSSIALWDDEGEKEGDAVMK